MTIGPFEGHLREAIALNRARGPMYAALSGGDSRAVSRLLIAAEWVLVPVARWFDAQSEPYHRAGIPMLEELFVSMDQVPAFGSVQLPANAVAAGSPPPAVADAQKRVHAAFASRSFRGAATAVAAELRGHQDRPYENALYRHVLESAQRLAMLAPGHIARSGQLGLPSPERLLTRLFMLHLRGLTAASMLDRRAQPLLARGIPILAQDLPPIPIPFNPPADA